jgi:hypothetical protein
MQVVSDDEAGLLLWHAAGSDFARLRDAEGNSQHEVPMDQMREPRLVPTTWTGSDILVLMPRNAAHSVWWFFNSGRFAGWYVNLEDPYVRHDMGVDTTDLVLDIWAEPDRTWRWKDEDEFAALTGNRLYFDAATAAVIRAEGERLVKLIEDGGFPFDGTYVDFQPDPSWSALRMPLGWDQAQTSS